MGTRVPITSQCDKNLSGITQLIEDLKRLSDDHDSADLVFLLGQDENRVYAHKIIMIARCKSFQFPKRGELCRIPGCSVSPVAPGLPTPIRLAQTNVDVFKQFLQYVYTGEDSGIFDMMTLAQDMGVDELKNACEEHAISTLSVSNACVFLTSIMEAQEKPSGAKCTASFMEKCISYIGENAAECVKTKPFLNLSKAGLIKLISSDYFCLEEEDVWRCVLAWAKYQAGVTQPTAHWTEEERVRVCHDLSGVMGHVRLLLIDSQVFAEEVEPTGAVPMELSLERYRHAALQSSTKIPGLYMTSSNVNSFNGAQLIENSKRLQPRLLLNMFPGSVIIKNDKLHFQTVLNGWYGFPKQTWRLVFRASSHGFSAAAFHKYCDGIAPTYVIAQGSRGEISGGFSDVSWSKTNRKGSYIHSERAFLFALNSETDTPTKYDIIKKPYAICYHPDFGPIFGGGADLFISNVCNTNMESYSNLPHSYDGPNASYERLFGDYNFTIAEYEIFTVASTSGTSNFRVESN